MPNINTNLKLLSKIAFSFLLDTFCFVNFSFAQTSEIRKVENQIIEKNNQPLTAVSII